MIDKIEDITIYPKDKKIVIRYDDEDIELYRTYDICLDKFNSLLDIRIGIVDDEVI